MADETHQSTIVNLRVNDYSSGSFEDIAATTAKYDYSKLDYDKLGAIYHGLESTGMQYGAMLARPIIDVLTAYEIGALPTPVCYDAASGKENADVTLFLQTFLRDQHFALLDACGTKNTYADGYLVFNVDRSLESIPPFMVFPGWSAYSSTLESATIMQVRRLKDLNSSKTAEVKITRNYNAKQIKYATEVTEASQGIKLPKAVTIPNPLGICPVVHLPNMRPSGFQFGVSDFYACIPYFLMFHHTLMRGYESQQYSGRPILTITGIEGNVKQWLKLSFDIDVDTESQDSLDSKILAMFKRHKMLALSGAVTAQFVESKIPIGKTEEILRMCLGQIARLSSVPEFVLGAALEQSNTSVREQYASLRAKISLKQAQLTPYLRHLLRMAMVWYTKISRNQETGEALETYGIVNTYEDARKNFKIELIWPEFLGSEQRTKMETLAMLAQAGAISKKGLIQNYPELIPSPEAELAQLETEQQEAAKLQQEFATPSDVKQPQATANAKERRRKDTSTQNNNDDAQKTNQRSNRTKV